MAQDVTKATLIFAFWEKDIASFFYVEVITDELHHNLVIVDIEKKKNRVEA